MMMNQGGQMGQNNPFLALGGQQYGQQYPNNKFTEANLLLRGNDDNDDSAWNAFVRQNNGKSFLQAEQLQVMRDIAGYTSASITKQPQLQMNAILSRKINPPIEDWWRDGRESFTDLLRNINYK